MRRLKAWCFYLAVFLFGLGSFQDAVTARELVVAVNHAPPYRIIEETSTGPVYSGIYIDVVRVAAARAGLVLHFEVVPFKRALYLMETGEADLMLGPNRTDDRQQFMYYFGAAFPNEPKAIYTGALDKNVREVSDLAHKSVGVCCVGRTMDGSLKMRPTFGCLKRLTMEPCFGCLICTELMR